MHRLVRSLVALALIVSDRRAGCRAGLQQVSVYVLFTCSR